MDHQIEPKVRDYFTRFVILLVNLTGTNNDFCREESILDVRPELLGPWKEFLRTVEIGS